jgi:hypothetical protein
MNYFYNHVLFLRRSKGIPSFPSPKLEMKVNSKGMFIVCGMVILLKKNE